MISLMKLQLEAFCKLVYMFNIFCLFSLNFLLHFILKIKIKIKIVQGFNFFPDLFFSLIVTTEIFINYNAS